jgi:hypothetical protein
VSSEDLDAVKRAIEGSPSTRKLVPADRGVIVAVAVIVASIVVAMTIPLWLLRERAANFQRDARTAEAVVEQLRCESDMRGERAEQQATAVAEILDAFAQLLLTGTRGEPPSSAIPAIEAAQNHLAAAAAERSAPINCPRAERPES